MLRSSLHDALYHLRRALGRVDAIVYRGGGYSFNRALDYWYDVEAYTASLDDAEQLRPHDPARAAQALHAATTLYRGEYAADLLAGEWQQHQRDTLHQRQLAALQTLGRWFGEDGQLEAAITAHRRALRHDAYGEHSHRALMRLYVQLGEPAQALRLYQQLAERLSDELATMPALETTALSEQIRAALQ